MAAATSQGAAKDLPRLDSSKFDFCYEFINSPAEEDLDGNGVADMTMNGSGWLTCSSQYSVGYGIFKCNSSNYIGSNQGAGSAGGVWRNYGVTSTSGFTIETRVQVRSSGGYGAIALTASASDSYLNAFVNFTTNAITWGSSASIVLTNLDMKASYHTCRIARAGGTTTYSVWVDDNLVAENLDDGLPYGSVLNRILIGSVGGSWWGEAVVSYLRFTKGGYAPLNEKDRRRDSADFEHKYEMDASDARFSPTATTSDWVHYEGADGTAALSDGILSVNQPKGKMCYYKTIGKLDSSISAKTPFTLETAVRVSNAWADSNGLVLSILCGTPRSATCFFIGTNTVSYTSGRSHVLQTDDNSDKMHVFRVTYKGEWPNIYTLYRDGEKIAETTDLAESNQGTYNFFRFGITSTSTHGGAFDVDYVRWTTDGAFIPPKPKKGLVISFK